MEALVVVLIIIVLARWYYSRREYQELSERIDTLARFVESRTAAPAPAPAPRAVEPAVVRERVAEPVVAAAPPVVPLQPPVVREPEPETAAIDWEAVVGGNWLNKLGVFVLVIGMALALGYSFRYLGPAGRVAVSAAGSVAMILGGVVFERRERYRTFGRGLIGGGWAALYFTAYAMYAVPAARVIEDPLVAALLLMAVAAGMIMHSLRYRSQAVTGLAYFIAFVTLAITEVNALSVVALAPLAASLLYVSRRFEWSRFAVLGLIATYLTCALRGDTGAPTWQAQAIFAIYWVLFEGFDILSEPDWLLPLNAVGFVGLSVAKWGSAAPERMWQFLAGAALAYLVSAAVRWRIAGRWHLAASVAVALAAWAIVIRAENPWVSISLLLEAELVYLAAVRLGVPLLRYVAGGVLLLEVAQLLLWQGARGWNTVAALSAAVFYFNRFWYPADVVYGFAGTGVLVWLTGRNAPNHDHGLAWILLAPVPFVVGWLRELEDFRLQACGVAVLSLGAMVVDAPEPALSLGIAAAVFFAGALVAEPEALRAAASFTGAALVMALLYQQVSGSALTVSWGAEGLALLMAGFPLRHRMIRFAGLGLLLICILKLFLYDLSSLETLPRILSFIGLGLILVGVSWLYTRFRERIQRFL